MSRRAKKVRPIIRKSFFDPSPSVDPGAALLSRADYRKLRRIVRAAKVVEVYIRTGLDTRDVLRNLRNALRAAGEIE